MQGFLAKIVDYWRLGLLLAVIFLLSWWRFEVLTARLVAPNELPEEFVGTIVSDPDVRGDGIFLTVKPIDLSAKFQSKILVKTARYPEWQYGDVVKVKGQLKLPEAFETDNGRIFNYPKYLAARGVGLTVSFAEVGLVKSSESWLRHLFKIKKAFTKSVNQAINEPAAALANGITVGEKQALPKDIQKAFQITSLSHIIVLSGYNINIVGDFLSRFGPAFGIVGIILFGIMVGGGASVWRAILMAIILVLGRRWGRNYDALRALVLVAILMSLYNPLWPLYDAGFQLSFLATAGILLGSEWWQKKLSWVTEKFTLRETLAVTLSAQTAVLPLLLYMSGILSFTSLPANVLVVPVVPFAMLLVFIVAIIGLIFPPLALILGYPVSWLLNYMIAVPTLLAKLPGGYITLPLFSGWVVVGVYLAILIYLGRRVVFSSDAKIFY